MSSNSSTTRMTSVLPKTARQAIQLTLELAADRGTIDASAALAITQLISDRQFAIDYKTKHAEELVKQKQERAEKKEARLQKMADKEGVPLQEIKDRMKKPDDDSD